MSSPAVAVAPEDRSNQPLEHVKPEATFHLSPEVITLIVKACDLKTIRNCRLASLMLKETADKELFETIRLKDDARSFAKAELVAQDSVFRTYVKTLVIQGNILGYIYLCLENALLARMSSL